MSRVAIIMSVYRSDDPDEFRLALNSVLEQDFKCHVFIFRDGWVCDSLQSHLDDFSHEESVTVIESNKNIGLAKALNLLIDKCMLFNFDYIARMDSDDISLPSRISTQVEFLDETPSVDVVGSFCKEFGSSFAIEKKVLPIEHEEIVDFSVSRCPLIHPTVMFRKEVFSCGIRYPTDTTFTEDMALWFHLLSKGFKFHNLPCVLLDYRLTEDTTKRRRGFDKALSEFKLRLKYMYLLNKVSFRNTVLIFSRLSFHLLPDALIKLAYKYLR